MAQQAQPDRPVEHDGAPALRIALGAGQRGRDRVADDRVGAQLLGPCAGRRHQQGEQQRSHPNTAAVVSAYHAAASLASPLRTVGAAASGLTMMPGGDSLYWPSTTR